MWQGNYLLSCRNFLGISYLWREQLWAHTSRDREQLQLFRGWWRYFPQHRSATHCGQGNWLDSETMTWSAFSIWWPLSGETALGGGCSVTQPLCLHRNFCHSTIEPTTVFMYSWGSVKNKQINKKHTRLKQNKTKQNNPQIERSKPLIDLVTAVPDKKLLSPQPPAPHGTWRPCIVSHLLLCCWWEMPKGPVAWGAKPEEVHRSGEVKQDSAGSGIGITRLLLFSSMQKNTWPHESLLTVLELFAIQILDAVTRNWLCLSWTDFFMVALNNIEQYWTVMNNI